MSVDLCVNKIANTVTSFLSVCEVKSWLTITTNAPDKIHKVNSINRIQSSKDIVLDPSAEDTDRYFSILLSLAPQSLLFPESLIFGVTGPTWCDSRSEEEAKPSFLLLLSVMVCWWKKESVLLPFSSSLQLTNLHRYYCTWFLQPLHKTLGPTHTSLNCHSQSVTFEKTVILHRSELERKTFWKRALHPQRRKKGEKSPHQKPCITLSLTELYCVVLSCSASFPAQHAVRATGCHGT